VSRVSVAPSKLWESEMGRRIKTETIERSRVLPVFMSPIEFWVALLIFVALGVGVGVLGLAFHR